jgi:hypothetical protein
MKLQCDTVLFHKHQSGHVLLALDCNNQPMRAWKDTKCYSPIKAIFIKSKEKFTTILSHLQPKKIYLNDGEPIASLLSDQSFLNCKSQIVYFNKSLDEILNDICLIPKVDEQTNNSSCNSSSKQVKCDDNDSNKENDKNAANVNRRNGGTVKVSNNKNSLKLRNPDDNTQYFISFEDFKILDPKATKKSYKRFISQM